MPVSPVPPSQVHCLRVHVAAVFPFVLYFPLSHAVQELPLSLKPALHDTHFALLWVGQAVLVAWLPLLQVQTLSVHVVAVFPSVANFPPSHATQEVKSVARLWFVSHDLHFAVLWVGQSVPVSPVPLLQVQTLSVHAETVFPIALCFPAAHVAQELPLSLKPALHDTHFTLPWVGQAVPVAWLPLLHVQTFWGQEVVPGFAPVVVGLWKPSLHWHVRSAVAEGAELLAS